MVMTIKIFKMSKKNLPLLQILAAFDETTKSLQLTKTTANLNKTKFKFFIKFKMSFDFF